MTLPTLLVASESDLRIHPEWSLATALDWRKIPRILEGSYPQKWPKPLFYGDDPAADLQWYRKARFAKYIVFDVETEQLPDGTFSGKIIQIGLYPKDGVPLIWDRIIYPGDEFIKMFAELIVSKKMVAHNAAFDVSRIRDNFDIGIWEYADLEDTILMHHILWAELPHSLEFIMSVYSKYPKAKHLGVGNYDYLVGDVVGTAEVYDALVKEFESDPDSLQLYYQTLKPLLKITLQFMEDGVKIDQHFVEECLGYIPQQMHQASLIANAYAGFPVLLESGTQLRALLVGLEDIFTKTKVKIKYTEKGEISLDKDIINELRNAFLPVDYNEQLDYDLVIERIEAGAHPLLEAKALWMNVRILRSNYIKPLLIPLDDAYQHQGSLHVGQGAPKNEFDWGTPE